ncbi:MAG: flagellar protein FlaG [Clostridia bacterium]|jgi:flagellar protein FlaG
MNDSYIDSITGVTAAVSVESQAVKEPPADKQTKDNINGISDSEPEEDIQTCDNKIQLDKQVEELNNLLIKDEKRVEYSIYKETNSVIFRVIDIRTNEIIKEIPSTKLIDLSVAVSEKFGLIANREV